MIRQRDGREVVLRGFEQISEQQIGIFERPELFEGLRYGEPDREFHGNSAAYHYQVERLGEFFIEHFEFVRREDRWAIMHQVIDLRAGERPELEEFVGAVRALIQDPHPVRTPADEFFNLDRDREIIHAEMILARNFIVLEQLRRLYQYDPDVARNFDFNNDRFISLWEIAPIKDLLFIPEFREPRDAMGPIERRADRNRDGFTDEGEFELFARRVFALAALPLRAGGGPSSISTATARSAGRSCWKDGICISGLIR
ncbi:MAG: hypothetical protein JSV89_00565 [Spirochaetaceae bacterium]|nr:MAG: hypothetical protein JSV89_00565 [Spirochaetaceae bacterium]